MKVTKTITIQADIGALPRLHANEIGVQIGEAYTEGEYDSCKEYVAPVIAWKDFDEFIAMLQEARKYKD